MSAFKTNAGQQDVLQGIGFIISSPKCQRNMLKDFAPLKKSLFEQFLQILDLRLSFLHYSILLLPLFHWILLFTPQLWVHLEVTFLPSAQLFQLA